MTPASARRDREPARLSRALFAAAGFVPVGCLCLALFGLLPLVLSARLVVLPLSGLAILAGARHRSLGRSAVLGLAAGIVATGVYDLFRLTLVLAGAWTDFIPRLGQMALGDPAASPLWGYLWRYVYDGGAMGLTFAMLGRRGMGEGLAFGVAICLCLFATLALAPGAQAALFVLGPWTGAGALVGHGIYGSVLGRLVGRWEEGREPVGAAPPSWAHSQPRHQ